LTPPVYELAAVIAPITSGDPLANARNVTPANYSLIFNFLAICSRLGDKYPFVVVPSR